MVVDRKRLTQVFEGLGQKLTKPATICLVGSAAGIASGQPDLQSQDIDVWRQKSSYDETEFRNACVGLGLLYDPKDELSPGTIYVQIVRPGIVKLPEDTEVELLAQYGNLTIVMPAPAMLSAAKLARGDARDIEDVAWWAKERALNLDDIRAAVRRLPNSSQRETAMESIILVELVLAPDRKHT